MASEDILENASAEEAATMEAPQGDVVPPAKPQLSSAPWVAELKAARKNQEKWHEQAARIDKRYLDKRDDSQESENKINLFTTNTQILIATLYARFPKPLVTREFEDQDDDVARVAANIIERMLMIRSRDDFDAAMRIVVQDRLVAGLGQMWFRYDPIIEKGVLPASTDPVTGEVTPEMPTEKIVHENAAVDYVFWQDFFWSPARTWGQVRWVARRVRMTKPDAEARFGAVIAAELKFTQGVLGGTHAEGNSAEAPERDDVKYADIFELWDKRSKTIKWISMDLPTILDSQPDKLKLDKFFPCPKPMFATMSSSNVMPRPDYLLAQDQYEELDSINHRITKLEQAIRVVGLHDGTNPEIERIFSEGIDNKILATRDFSAFSEKGGFKGAIDWLPVEAFVNAIEKLRTYRQDLVSQIYEITGISDIMRGSSKASETLGAQQLKAQYGSVKLQFLQMEVASFVEEALEIKAQIIRNLFQPETIVRESNIENSVDVDYMGPALQLIKSPLFDLRVQVHADSMAVPEFTAEREGRMAFVRSIGEMMTAAAPILEKSPQAGATMLRVLQWAAASFRTGNSIESILDKAIRQIEEDAKKPKQAPPPPPTEVAQVHKDESQAILNIAKARQADATAVATLTEPAMTPEPPEPKGEV